MIPFDTELEFKLDADTVSIARYMQWCAALLPKSFECVQGRDAYYEDGHGHVVRHRTPVAGEGTHELTIQGLRGRNSINRSEVDLTQVVHPQLVGAFMTSLGFRLKRTLEKKSWIFRFGEDPEVVVALYDAKCEGRPATRRFLEVEVAKGSDVSTESARAELDRWLANVRADFGPLKRLDQSLYQLFGGRAYPRAKR